MAAEFTSAATLRRNLVTQTSLGEIIQ